MSELPFPGTRPVPWLLRPYNRQVASVLVGGACLVATTQLPRETRIILSLDLFLLTYMALLCVLTSVATAEQCANLAVEGRALEKKGVLIATVLVSVASITAIGVMLNSQRDREHWLKVLHMAGSLAALFLGWMTAQMIFGIQYMRLYYNSLYKSRGAHSEPDLRFPGQSAPDLWDFMYFSFTVAMCFGTTDISIVGAPTRRLTLLHAIYSFFFVATIIGFVMSVLSNAA